MPRWNANEAQANYLPIFLLLVFSILYVIVSFILIGVSSLEIFQVINLVLVTIIFLFVFSRFYIELNVQKDYVELNKQGIFYRNSQQFDLSFRPHQDFIPRKDLENADLLETKYFLSDKVIHSIILKDKQGNFHIIGTRLSLDQLTQITIILKGFITISNSLSTLFSNHEIEDSVQNLIENAKNLWKRVTKVEDKEEGDGI